MAQYEYPKMTGYEWNAIQKISIALGIPIESIYTCGTQNNTYIGFNDIELTIEQKAILDGIMSNNPCAVPVSTSTQKTTYKIPDLWNMRQWFYTQWGIVPTMWFEKGNEDGSGECYIHLEFPRVLTKAEKNQIISVYANAIKERV